MRVHLFVTCLGDTFYPRAAIACVRLLEYFGCEVVFDPRQTCCGQPFRNNGHDAEARGLAQRMLELFTGDDPVVTPSASCAAMVREQFPLLFADEPATQQQAEQLASRTFEVIEFLTTRPGFEPAAIPAGSGAAQVVTVHESCHQRGIGRFGQVTALLGRMGGVEVRTMKDVEQCCGFGGTFAAKFADVSGPIAAEKADAIAATGAPTVVSSDAGCTLNIAGTCARRGVRVRFCHAAELLAERLGLLDPEDDGDG